MSVTQTHVTVIVAEEAQTSDGDAVADALIQGDPVAVARLIAHVLRRAYVTAERFDAPNEARAILHVAHSFADELAGADQAFDRLRFIQAVTDGRS
jgi:hypothetical protein